MSMPHLHNDFMLETGRNMKKLNP
uniref:Uncharacterized protein n=1 Tax=Arundo donax TaxID=35708 RepID=A0A0A8Z6L6_ARUDO